jgi:hypothetical protein
VPHRAVECVRAADRVIGREHEQDRIVRLARDRRNRHGGGGVAAGGLENDARGDADFGELVPDQEAVRFVADHDRLTTGKPGARRVARAQRGVLRHTGA